MKMLRSRSAVAATLAATLSMVATPALARDYWGGYRHRDRVDAGDVIAGVLVIGGIAAIASAASKSARDRRSGDYRYPERRTDGSRYPDARYPDNRYPDARYPDRDGSGRYGDYQDGDTRYGDRNYGNDANSQRMGMAVDTCVSEVERGSSRVDNVDRVDRENGDWRVDGRMDDGRDFSCRVDDSGRVRNATVGGQGVY